MDLGLALTELANNFVSEVELPLHVLLSLEVHPQSFHLSSQLQVPLSEHLDGDVLLPKIPLQLNLICFQAINLTLESSSLLEQSILILLVLLCLLPRSVSVLLQLLLQQAPVEF